MLFNLMFPMRAIKHYDRWIQGSDLGEVARIVEAAGFDGLSVSEHPYPDHAWLGNGGHHAFDPFVSLTYMAAHTTRVKLITYVMVSGYRHPYLAAKAIASLDNVSRGRLIMGMAAGYLRSEFEVLGADFSRRGALLNAAIPAMRAAWADADHDSPDFPARGHTMLPAPAQKGGPPIWIGGNSPAARKRAITLGDGWMPMATSAEMAAIIRTPALGKMDELGALIADAQAERSKAGRDPLDVAFVPFEQPLLRSGDVDEFATTLKDQLAAYEAAGVTWITVEPASRSLDIFRQDVERLSSILIGSKS
jgi:probable F420-dependent oxidoreductase